MIEKGKHITIVMCLPFVMVEFYDWNKDFILDKPIVLNETMGLNETMDLNKIMTWTKHHFKQSQYWEQNLRF